MLKKGLETSYEDSNRCKHSKPANQNANPKCKGIGELTLLDFLEQAEGKNQNLADKQIALTKGGTLNLTILTLDGYGVQIQSRGVNVLLNTSIGWKYEMTPAEFPRKILFHLLE